MDHAELRKKFIQGTELAIKRLIERKKRDDGYIVVSENGKVVKIRARDIKR